MRELSGEEIKIIDYTVRVAKLTRLLPITDTRFNNDCEDVYRHLRAIQNVIYARRSVEMEVYTEPKTETI